MQIPGTTLWLELDDEPLGYWCARCGIDIYNERGEELLRSIAESITRTMQQEPELVYIPPLGVVVEEYKSGQKDK